ncbi:hypothetical protein HMPREF1862_00056 [Varibaculum cambriense]|uniref:Uncharacterized protein n=1 Tax=Varibaculum cambriense TaxID=184870 RepID=A0AB34X1R5_9ACTO|nr:hypothetical protein HMPREF1862_00056 [Varibaculum cambriense]
MRKVAGCFGASAVPSQGVTGLPRRGKTSPRFYLPVTARAPPQGLGLFWRTAPGLAALSFS